MKTDISKDEARERLAVVFVVSVGPGRGVPGARADGHGTAGARGASASRPLLTPRRAGRAGELAQSGQRELQLDVALCPLWGQNTHSWMWHCVPSGDKIPTDGHGTVSPLGTKYAQRRERCADPLRNSWLAGR